MRIFSLPYVLYACLSVVVLLLVGCNSDDVVPPEPEIQLLSVGPTTVTAFEDSLVFRLSYRDGDGDLGTQNPDTNSLFIIDTRDSTVHGFRIPQLGPTGEQVAIQGTLEVTLQQTVLLDTTQTQETAVFDLLLYDRAGNASNRVSSPSITVTAQ